MGHKKFGVRSREWWKHLGGWHKRYQERAVRADGKKKCRDVGDIVRGYSRDRQ
jgi:hypothetical protein